MLTDCSNCGGFYNIDDLYPKSPDEGVWCDNCFKGLPASNNLALGVVDGVWNELSEQQLKQLAVDYLETLKRLVIHRSTMEKLRGTICSFEEEADEISINNVI